MEAAWLTVSTDVIFQLCHTGCLIPFLWQTAAPPPIFLPCSQSTLSFSPRVTPSIPHICLYNGRAASLLMLHYDDRHWANRSTMCVLPKSSQQNAFLFYTSDSATTPRPSAMVSLDIKMHHLNQWEQRGERSVGVEAPERHQRSDYSSLSDRYLVPFTTMCALSRET